MGLLLLVVGEVGVFLLWKVRNFIFSSCRRVQLVFFLRGFPSQMAWVEIIQLFLGIRVPDIYDGFFCSHEKQLPHSLEVFP